MPLKNQQHAIKQVFEQELECARLLLQSLEHEYKVLSENDVEILEAVVGEKQERMLQLEVISRQRESLLESCNMNMAGEKTLAPQENKKVFSDNKQLSELWSSLIDVAEKCRDRNRVNGSIVEIISKQSRHALDILQGISPAASAASELYDNTGQSVRSANKRSLIQA